VQTQKSSPFLRAIPEPLTAQEIDRQARAIYENIAAETGSRHTHAGKVARLYLLCRDIQHAALQGARFATVRRVLELIGEVFARSYGMQPRGA
jgi:hypothetical protein